MIKLFDPHVTDEEVKAATEVLLSHNWASGAGTNKVKEFEERFTAYISSRDTVALNSGTAALHLALLLLDVKDKDILVPSLTFVSTAHAADYNGGHPVFVDVDPKTLCMDPNDLVKKIRPGKSAVVIPVHFGGMPCNMKEILKICNENNVQLVDDAAHACGGIAFDNKKVGSIDGMLTCFSFHPVKNLAMPTGGAITINLDSHSNVKKKLNSLRWCGIDNREGTSYDVTSIAPNYYMNEISAAVGLVQLSKLDRLNVRRREIARRYYNEIDIKHKMSYHDDCVYHLYWILSNEREEMIKHLNSKGIEVGTHYRPIHTMTAYKHIKTDTPITDEIGKKIVTIPIHVNLTDNEVSYIIDSINSFINNRVEYA